MVEIPIHRLHEQTNLGLWIQHIELQGHHEKALDVHRDDHYIFAIMEKGACQITVDFSLFEARESALFYVLPGQIHHGAVTNNITGWFVALDAAYIPEAYRKVFESDILRQYPLPLTASQLAGIKDCLLLLYNHYQQASETIFYRPILHSLAATLTGIIATCYLEKEATGNQPNSRPLFITRQFKAMLRQQYLTQKSPAAYAEALHLSLSYLNECVKGITGFSVTYWIQHEIMLEARRLLFYTEMNVKEIAFALGYDDHTYFSRLFTKAVGMPAGQFRRQYRESSNLYP